MLEYRVQIIAGSPKNSAVVTNFASTFSYALQIIFSLFNLNLTPGFWSLVGPHFITSHFSVALVLLFVLLKDSIVSLLTGVCAGWVGVVVVVVEGFCENVSGLVEKMCLGHNVGILKTVNLFYKFCVCVL